MTYVIGSACIDVTDKSCVQECPADCIYEGDRSLYINPDECVDCGACKPACRLEAIVYETDLADDERRHLADNAAFFRIVLPGQDEPLGSPGAPMPSGESVRTPRWWPQCRQDLIPTVDLIEATQVVHGEPVGDHRRRVELVTRDQVHESGRRARVDQPGGDRQVLGPMSSRCNVAGRPCTPVLATCPPGRTSSTGLMLLKWQGSTRRWPPRPSRSVAGWYRCDARPPTAFRRGRVAPRARASLRNGSRAL
jgi:NAD-dependent dihydropyrimidine dehydrogenase PreA subunit